MPYYEWRDGARMKGSAQAIGDEIEKLREAQGGFVRPTDVLDAAADPASPLHHHFEWDDTEAAHRFRLHQASTLIRSVVVRYAGDENDGAYTRAFLSVDVEQIGATYTSLAHAMSDEDLRAQVMRRAWRELEAFRKKYEEYQHLSNALAKLEPALEELAG